MSGEEEQLFSNSVLEEFAALASRVRERARTHREAARLRSVVDDVGGGSEVVDVRKSLGVVQTSDVWRGCTNLRTLRTLLSIVDDRGFER